MFWKSSKRGQRGQSAVETAIVMPLNVFIILAIIQNGLIAQARVMTKYAAYRAVRVGAMNNARVDMMTNAALTTLLPVLATPKNGTGPYVFPDMSNMGSAAAEVGEAIALNTALKGSSLRPVQVTICNPVQSQLTSLYQSNFTPNGGSAGSANEVDFDDPRASTEMGPGMSGNTFSQFMATKLSIQVHFNYPMIIPFANAIISEIYLSQYIALVTVPDVLRMSGDQGGLPSMPTSAAYQAAELWAATKTGAYLAPINVSYSMRMQSNLYKQIPGSGMGDSPGTSGNDSLPTQNNCVHYVN